MSTNDLNKKDPRTFKQWRKDMKTKWFCFLHIIIYPDRVLKRLSKAESEVIRLRMIEKGVYPGTRK